MAKRQKKSYSQSSKNKEKGKQARRAKATTNNKKLPAFVVGIVDREKFGYVIKVANRKDNNKYIASKKSKAQDCLGELVKARVLQSIRRDHTEVEILKTLGDPNDPKKITEIAIEAHDIPLKFSKAAKEQAKAAKPVTLKGREDLRKVPFVTIDGEDARDFDDAVYAEKDGKGWKLSVAIADVAHYVQTGSALDKDAYNRGNSTYFPDRVVPMLPEELSNELCSLKPNVDRAALVVHMWVDSKGILKKWKFERAVIKSHARLTYTQVQSAIDGNPAKEVRPLIEDIIMPLYDAYNCLSHARTERGTLDFEFPERKVILGKNGHVKTIATVERLDAHRLIEEFMITANVAAASELEKKAAKNQNLLCLYRVHDKPSEIKLAALREYLETVGISLVPDAQMHPSVLAKLIEDASGTDQEELINEIILRTQSQAVYSPENIGHFGLALAKYAHFTSPIRRYADLVVHRALISTCNLGKDGLTEQERLKLEDIGEHISKTERRSISAERETTDRFVTLYMSDLVGKTFDARISGVASFGLFVRIDETGADGIVPFRDLPRDFYRFDEGAHALIGERTGLTFQLSQEVQVKLKETNKLTGSMAFKIVNNKKSDAGFKKKKKKKIKLTKKTQPVKKKSHKKVKNRKGLLEL